MLPDYGAITPRSKAPKKGTGYSTHGGKWCKHLCDRFEKTRPYREPYETHVFCSSCTGTGVSNGGVWYEKEWLKENGRCPCCNRRPRTKPKQSGNYHKTHGVK